MTTIYQFARQLDRPARSLLEELRSAGVAKASPDDALSDSEKERLLNYLRSGHDAGGGTRKKITLTRKSTSEIEQIDPVGKARTIQVEVRGNRTFVKRDDIPVGHLGDGSSQASAERQARQVLVPEAISVVDLARKMSTKPRDVIKQLMKLGKMVTLNQQLDQETAMIVVEEMGHKALMVMLDDSETISEASATEVQAGVPPTTPVVVAIAGAATDLPSGREDVLVESDEDTEAQIQSLLGAISEIRATLVKSLARMEARPLISPLSLFEVT